MNNRPLNIVNATDVTNWVKALTWGATPAAVRSTDIRSREFVTHNTDTVAKMMCHSYIKKFILLYMHELVGTPALRAPAADAELSDSVRAAAADGLAPYIFNATDVPHDFTSKIKKLNKFLFDAAIKYFKQQTSQADTEFDFNIQHLVREFPDYQKTISQAHWNVRMPEKQNVSNVDIMRTIQGADNEK